MFGKKLLEKVVLVGFGKLLKSLQEINMLLRNLRNLSKIKRILERDQVDSVMYENHLLRCLNGSFIVSVLKTF